LLRSCAALPTCCPTMRSPAGPAKLGLEGLQKPACREASTLNSQVSKPHCPSLMSGCGILPTMQSVSKSHRPRLVSGCGVFPTVQNGIDGCEAYSLLMRYRLMTDTPAGSLPSALVWVWRIPPQCGTVSAGRAAHSCVVRCRLMIDAQADLEEAMGPGPLLKLQ